VARCIIVTAPLPCRFLYNHFVAEPSNGIGRSKVPGFGHLVWVIYSQNFSDVGLTEIKGRLLLLDFLDLFRSYRTGTLNSTPQLFARDRSAVAQGAQLGPGDLRMDAAA
jgi:hypothetical protein